MLWYPSVNQMSDGRPDDWLFDTLNRLEAQQVRHAAEIRSEMRTGFEGVKQEFRAHEHEDRRVADRVLTLENERDERRKQIISRTTMIAIIAGLPGAALAVYTLMHVAK